MSTLNAINLRFCIITTQRLKKGEEVSATGIVWDILLPLFRYHNITCLFLFYRGTVRQLYKDANTKIFVTSTLPPKKAARPRAENLSLALVRLAFFYSISNSEVAI